MEKQVLWVPFKTPEEKMKQMLEEAVGDDVENEEDIFGEDDDDDEDDHTYQDKYEKGGRLERRTQVVMHHGGGNEMSAIGRYKYRPWLFLTNFEISSRKYSQLKSLPGVEHIEQMTRYQYFVGIGVLFCKHEVHADLDDVSAWDSSEVRRKMEKVILDDENLLDKPPTDMVESHKSRLEQEFEHWAFLIFPNGKVAETGTNDLNDEQFIRLRNLYHDTADGTNAECFSNVEL